MKKLSVVLIAALFLIVSAAAASAAVKNATVTINQEYNGTEAQPVPGNATAGGGNVTDLDLLSESITASWHGFYGEVNGNISLENAAGNKLYQWAGNESGGEMFASLSAAVAWATIQAENDCTTDEAYTGTGSDRVNNTFIASNNTAFTVGGTNIAVSTSCRTNTFVNSAAQTASFEEVILDDTTNIVYTGLLESDVTGFDGSTHDFQIIVPDNRTDPTPLLYYFYVELGS